MRNKNKRNEKRHMPLLCRVLLIAAGILVILVCVMSFGLASFTVHGRRQTLEEARKWQGNHYDLTWYDTIEKEDYLVKGYEDYELHVQLLKNPAGEAMDAVHASITANATNADGNTTMANAVNVDGDTTMANSVNADAVTDAGDKYVIITHGYTDNRFGAMKYVKFYLDLGFNCIVYDLRGHGENAEAICTYSIKESKDLNALISDTYDRYGKNIYLGLQGESLGSATTISVLGQRQDVKFAVADCGFADIENVLQVGIKSMHLPSFMVKLASLACKIRYGFFFSEAQPIQSLSGNQVPILFIHGADDTFIVPDNSKRMSEATAGYSEFYTVPGAAHAMSAIQDPTSYAKYIEAFLEKIQ